VDLNEILKNLKEKKINPIEAKELMIKYGFTAKDILNTQESDMVPEEPIAIIGMSGRYPKASDMHKYWKLLKNGLDAVSEIPVDRWNTREYNKRQKREEDIIYCNYMGSLNNPNAFDPLFFEISPFEAEWMDPQQRIFLEEGYKAFEDAGYTRQKLNGCKCGIYLGMSNGEYKNIMIQNHCQNSSVTGVSDAIAAARLAYFLNLKGPALCVDTACSSSLVSVHLAVQGLKSKETDMALVGGVSLYLTPESYSIMSCAGMLSKSGRCKAFDNDADGFVPGEGCGAVVLKRLDDAKRDRDYVYGLIIASGINQDGKSNSITAPNMGSQIELVSDLYKKFNIDPATITYAELHGTGTKIGDPIELESLKTAFSEKTKNRNFCGIGSVKSNIGHTSAAAGVAGLQKVVLCLNHHQLVPTLHVNKTNEHFDFSESPFYINKELKEWKVHGNNPRRACINSFGFSGTNAHVVLEEYISEHDSKDTFIEEFKDSFGIFVLSAKNEKQLIKYAKSMLNFLEEEYQGRFDDLLYTLQCGKESMRERLSIITCDLEDLKDKLRVYLKAGVNGKTILRSTVNLNAFQKSGSRISSHNAEKVEFSLAKKAADEWLNGIDIEWDKLYLGRIPERVPIITYPFVEENYWLPISSTKTDSDALHPLVHEELSDNGEQHFRSSFNGSEQFLKDHIIAGLKTLPGAVTLEMARAAGEIIRKDMINSSIINVSWIRPLILTNDFLVVDIYLYDKGDNISFEIYKQDKSNQSDVVIKAEEALCVTGVLEFTHSVIDGREKLDIDDIYQRCNLIIPGDECYSTLNTYIEYGDSFKTIKEVTYNDNEVLACLECQKNDNDYFLDPYIIDGALQSTSVLLSKNRKERFLPFGLEKINIYSSIPKKIFVYSTKAESITDKNSYKFNLKFLDESGMIFLEIHNFSLKAKSNSNRLMDQNIYLSNVWKEVKSKEIDIEPLSNEENGLLVFTKMGSIDTNQNIIVVEHGIEFESLGNRKYRINPEKREDFETLFSELKSLNALPYKIIYAYSLDQQIGNDKLFSPFNEMLNLTQILLNYTNKKKVKLLYLYDQDHPKRYIKHAALSGFFRTVYHENKLLDFKMLEVDSELNDDVNNYKRIYSEFLSEENEREIKISKSQRFVKRNIEVSFSNLDQRRQSFKKEGTYLITGGLGGIGYLLASYLCKEYNANLILIGRRDLDKSDEKRVKELENNKSRIKYFKADISHRKEVEALAALVKSKFCGLDGIIHSAGIVKDSLIYHKKFSDAKEVMRPKVLGIQNLDEVFEKEKLDFFIVLSSTSSLLGNVGQADYCYANRYIDIYSEYRDELYNDNKRYGKTYSINWPYWAEGGMEIHKDAEDLMTNILGMDPLSTESAMLGLEKCLTSENSQIAVVSGQRNKILSTFNVTEKEILKFRNEAVENFLIEVIADKIKIDKSSIDTIEPFETYGIDSILIMSITRKLEEYLGDLPKTLFFEYKNIEELAEYIATAKKAKMLDLFGTKEDYRKPKSSLNQNHNEDIVIVGLSGRYPKANNLNEFWINLKKGVDCISEVPKKRWNHSLYYDPERGKADKTYSKWGGFLDDIEMFDPMFFNITPNEAKYMDPQVRLFLETAWHTIEDAGYTRSSLRNQKVGVFVGVMYGMYELLEGEYNGIRIPLSAPYASVANRVSYFMDFHGPSMAIDTMCSSSLTAIHLACESIRSGGCDTALAGGVNLTLHPNKLILLSQGNFTSSDGRCRSFGKDGDGYVPGEGVGAVLLKPLSKAIQDNDNIYAIIKGSSINAGGKTNGYTVPNPIAQAKLIEETIEKSGINPRTIGYVEAHGTGTSLGDPIEIKGLEKVYSKYTSDKQYCSIGSVKSNIGHLESAAGIAALTKVLLQMKYKMLVPSIHTEELNPFIHFTDTPFFVQRTLERWEPYSLDGIQTKERPLRAAVSAFGAGGSNAHIILEK